MIRQRGEDVRDLSADYEGELLKYWQLSVFYFAPLTLHIPYDTVEYSVSQLIESPLGYQARICCHMRLA